MRHSYGVLAHKSHLIKITIVKCIFNGNQRSSQTPTTWHSYNTYHKKELFWENATSYEYATQIMPMFSIKRI